jgi:hypothetical protein|tara:strand:+ start:17323 stop:17571 length:249 start_codon:yes stop_codon:yes gene_type:complete
VNGQDKKDLNVILERMDRADEDRKAIRQDIKFIKENLFDPHKGLWAETRLNTQFRESTNRWRGVIGTGFVGLCMKQMWDILN